MDGHEGREPVQTVRERWQDESAPVAVANERAYQGGDRIGRSLYGPLPRLHGRAFSAYPDRRDGGG